MKSKLKLLLPFSLLGVTLLVLAKVIGPFHVSTAGPKYAQVTYDMDADMEYAAANAVFMIMVQPFLSPTEKLRAIKEDFVRIVYWDGKIADFKILRFYSSLNLQLAKEGLQNPVRGA